jgi:chromosome segregation ATPase
MEPNTQKPITNYQSPKPKTPMYLIAVIITLSVVAIVLGVLLLNKSKQSTTYYEEKVYVEEQKSQLEGELNGLIEEYDSLKTNNDSINKELEGQQTKIRKLLSVQASNTQKIKMYENELETLRKVMRSYIVQIDSLNTRNRYLTEENIQVKGDLQQKEIDYDKLSQVKEELVTKVALAQKLSAKDILAVGLNDRSKEKDRVSKVEKIRACFTIREK